MKKLYTKIEIKHKGIFLVEDIEDEIVILNDKELELFRGRLFLDINELQKEEILKDDIKILNSGWNIRQFKKFLLKVNKNYKMKRSLQ